MEVLVTIVDSVTGKQATYGDEFENEGVAEFLWSGGNYSCDCNRALFLSRETGDESIDCDCGDGRFAVKIIRTDTKQVVYADGHLASSSPEIEKPPKPESPGGQ